jgi:hypothetical protein
MAGPEFAVSTAFSMAGGGEKRVAGAANLANRAKVS